MPIHQSIKEGVSNQLFTGTSMNTRSLYYRQFAPFFVNKHDCFFFKTHSTASHSYEYTKKNILQIYTTT